METVLVTGGSGFIASWAIAGLLRDGYQVRATARSMSKEGAIRVAAAKAGVSDANLSVFAADLNNDQGWDEAVSGCDYVLHIASPLGGNEQGDRESFVRPALDGTLRVLRGAVKARVKRVVMTSAAAATRPPLDSGRASEETVWADPDDPQFDSYRASKIIAEKAAWEFMREHGGRTEFTTVLPGAVFGPVLTRDGRGSVSIIADMLRGSPAALPKLGFWVVDVRDLADLHIHAMKAPQAAGQRFIAAGEFQWMEDIAKTLIENLGDKAKKVPTRRLPGFVVRLMLPFRPHLRTLAPLIGKRFPLSNQKARSLLGFAPRPVKETIVDCAESLLAIERA